MNISHTALWISDLKRTKYFYTEILDLDLAWEKIDEDGVHNLYISGNLNDELQFKYDPNDTTDIITDPIDHIALTVDDIEKCIKTIKDDTDCEITKSPTTRETRRGYKARISLVEGPNGYTVELVKILK